MNLAEQGWYVRSRGRVLGPFPFTQLEVLKNQGRLAKFDEVSCDRRSWVSATSLPELFAPSAAPAAVAARGEAPAEPLKSGYSVATDPQTAAPAGEEVVAWFYMMADHGQIGPVGLAELIRLTRSGVVRSDTYVRHSGLNDWIRAREVPALGLQAAAPPTVVPAALPVAKTGINAMSLAGFILGVLGLLAGATAFLASALVSTATRNREVLTMTFLGLVGVWGVSSLLAVILSPIGMVRANRAGGERRGFGLGLTGMVLGIVGLVGLLILMYLAALGVIVATGATRFP